MQASQHFKAVTRNACSRVSSLIRRPSLALRHRTRQPLFLQKELSAWSLHTEQPFPPVSGSPTSQFATRRHHPVFLPNLTSFSPPKASLVVIKSLCNPTGSLALLTNFPFFNSQIPKELAAICHNHLCNLSLPGNPSREMDDTALITRPKLARLLDFFPPKADKRWMFYWQG